MFLVQLVGEWLSLVEQYTHPTVPVELRQAVATGLGHLWRTLLQVYVVYITLVLSWNTYILTYENSILALELEGGNYVDLTHALSISLKPELSVLVETYSMLVVGLLQDGVEEVREEMATSVGTILSSLSPSVGMRVFYLHTRMEHLHV